MELSSRKRWTCAVCLSSMKQDGKRIAKPLLDQCKGKPPAWQSKLVETLRRELVAAE